MTESTAPREDNALTPIAPETDQPGGTWEGTPHIETPRVLPDKDVPETGVIGDADDVTADDVTADDETTTS